VRDITESPDNITTSTNTLVTAFDCAQFKANSALVQPLDPAVQSGAHIALNEARELQILDWVWQNAQQNTSITKGEMPQKRRALRKQFVIEDIKISQYFNKEFLFLSRFMKSIFFGSHTG
jgi:hypothetical protein